MKYISVEMFPSRCGDSFLIRFDNKKNFVIDMGYDDTYSTYIRSEFIKLKDIEKQKIDLLVITHIDEDHILGAIEFFKENNSYNNQQVIDVSEIWHNSYKHLQYNIKKEKVIDKDEQNILKEMSIANTNTNNNKIEENRGISAEQGSTLAGYLYKFGYCEFAWNKSFDNNAVNVDYKNIAVFGDIKIILLSPNTNKLLRLSKKWLNELKKRKFNFKLSDDKIFDDAYEFYLRYLNDEDEIEEGKTISYKNEKFDVDKLKDIEPKHMDVSSSNGSSISFIIEYKNKKLLFLGDSHEDVIIESLSKLADKGYKLDFDLVKIPHHGSIKNNVKWINMISAEYYLISTNGEHHGHPNEEVIAKIITSNRDKHKNLIFNYDLEVIKKFDDEKLREKYNYTIIIPDNDKSINIEL